MRKIFFIFLFTIVIASPYKAKATEVRLEVSRVEVQTGDEFMVDIIAFTNEAVNAVEGRLIFGNLLEVVEIRDGGSVINFWIEKPRLENSEVVVFSGITPGGFMGTNSQLFSVVFRAKEEGLASLRLEGIQILKNDGKGTLLAVSLRPISVLLTRGDSSVETEVLKDTTSPEPFIANIDSYQERSGQDWFLAFSTQDKKSGVAYYEVKEYRNRLLSFLAPWKKVESPYRIPDQERKSFIVIRAVDKRGNMYETLLPPTNQPVWYEQGFIIPSILLIFGLYGLVMWFMREK